MLSLAAIECIPENKIQNLALYSDQSEGREFFVAKPIIWSHIKKNFLLIKCTGNWSRKLKASFSKLYSK